MAMQVKGITQLHAQSLGEVIDTIDCIVDLKCQVFHYDDKLVCTESSRSISRQQTTLYSMCHMFQKRIPMIVAQ